MQAQRLVQFDGVTKRFETGTTALTDVSFSIRSNVIHAICGENGAGKSTLMKVLLGLEHPTDGRLLVDGQAVRWTSAADAARAGFAMVHQHFSLLPSLTV